MGDYTYFVGLWLLIVVDLFICYDNFDLTYSNLCNSIDVSYYLKGGL